MQKIRALLLSPWLYHPVRVALGLLFVWAGAVKLSDPRSFAALISQYGLVPDTMLVAVAIGLPLLEIGAGIGTIFAIRGSLVVVFGLLALFLAVLRLGILADLEVDCGCFSPAEKEAHAGLRAAFFRDWALVGVVAYLACCHRVNAKQHPICTRSGRLA